jgi:hypothetical protein
MARHASPRQNVKGFVGGSVIKVKLGVHISIEILAKLIEKHGGSHRSVTRSMRLLDISVVPEN